MVLFVDLGLKRFQKILATPWTGGIARFTQHYAYSFYIKTVGYSAKYIGQLTIQYHVKKKRKKYLHYLYNVP